jgi:hypothetical protein
MEIDLGRLDAVRARQGKRLPVLARGKIRRMTFCLVNFLSERTRL